MTEPVIQVQELVKRYGDQLAVDRVSFDVNPGEIFAFVGPNGAGKTTTIEIIECLRPLTAGSVSVFGLDVNKANEIREIKKRIGVLPQDFSALDRLTVRENISLFADMYSKHSNIDDILKLLGLSEKTKQRFETLSGGLQHRVGIAAALVNDPEVLFLDEPTSGLDPGARRSTWEIIKRLKFSGKTVFLTTHYMEEAQFLADRIAIIMKGKIAAIGTPRELIDQYGGRKQITFKGGGHEVAQALRNYGIEASVSDSDVSVSYSTTLDIERALAALEARKLRPEIELKSPNVEDVFLKITGFRLTEAGEAAS